MSQEPKRILVVEDEVIVAFELTDLLEDLGFEVVGPSVHLEDAIKRAKQDDFDAAFLDVNLGKGKTSRPVKEVLDERGIPYIFITAYDANSVEFIDQNDRVLTKPVTGDRLLQVLRKAYPDMER